MKRAALAISACLSMLWAPQASAGGAGKDGDAPPPVVTSGGRRVDVRNERGGLSSYWSIPSGSTFKRPGADGTKYCSFVARLAGETSDGQPYERGDVIRSVRWIFAEGAPPSNEDVDPVAPVSAGPLSAVTRTFTIFCDEYDALHSIGIVRVPAHDPMFDPLDHLDELYAGLQLVRPTVFTNPVVDTWGGLVTRYPAWLAIAPDAWRLQWSSTAWYMGWELRLSAEPSRLEFFVDFVPNQDKPSPEFHGVVGCIEPGTSPATSDAALPAMPTLPDQAEPNHTEACVWTPPGPGSVTIQARISYTVTLWAGSYTEPVDDYVWTSEPVTFATGDLTAVNVDPAAFASPSPGSASGR